VTEIPDDDSVGQRRESPDMVKMGMGYEYILQIPLFLLGKHRPYGAGIQEQVAVDQKGRRPEVGKFRSGTAQYP
jgi:hypothetical protein